MCFEFKRFYFVDSSQSDLEEFDPTTGLRVSCKYVLMRP